MSDLVGKIEDRFSHDTAHAFQNGPKVGRNSKVTKLLDVLPLRGVSTFEKFCDSLQLAGQVFIAELLRDEGNALQKPS